MFGGRPPACSLLEASTESEWVARHLEALGHEVIVADPNYAPIYANHSRRTGLRAQYRASRVASLTQCLETARSRGLGIELLEPTG